MTNLYRSRTNRMVAGIFGGLGEIFTVDPTILRMIFVVLAVLTGIIPLLLLYLLAWVIIPEKSAVTQI